MNIKILEKMGFRRSPHNEIFYDHLECITDFLKAQCPIDKKKAIAMLRGSTGISNRYVKEHLDSLIAWEVIKSHAGNYTWIFDIEKKPETIQENIISTSEEIKPCKWRTDFGRICNAIPGKAQETSVIGCMKCKIRITDSTLEQCKQEDEYALLE